MINIDGPSNSINSNWFFTVQRMQYTNNKAVPFRTLTSKRGPLSLPRCGPLAKHLRAAHLASSRAERSQEATTSANSAVISSEETKRSAEPQIPNRPSSSVADSVPRIGVIVVDHGSRRKASNEMLEEFADMYRDRSGRVIVEAAHMELAEPSIATAFDRCVARGANRVVISPYFLSRGKHIQEDIPSLAAEAAARHPGVTYVVAEPIGLDPLMAQIIDARVRAAAAQWRDDRPLGAKVVEWLKSNFLAY